MFYPEKRDGFARLGRLEFGDERVATPFMLSFLDRPEIVEHIDFGKAPYAAKSLVSDELMPKNEHVNVVTGLSRVQPRELVDILSRVRSEKPVYAVAAATPANASLLIYLGADILDDILAIAKGYDGVYFLGDLEVNVERLKNFPCSCQFCKNREIEELSEEEVLEAIAGHNSEMLKIEVEKCRVLLKQESLRDYVEAKVKLLPEMTAALRIADTYSRSDHTFPRYRRSKCLFTTAESASRFEVRYFLKRAVEIYEPKTPALLLLPCTARKPYLTSRTHRILRSAVRIDVNEIIVSSPLVVPREFELTYPAVNYDTPVTGQWSDEEISFVASWLRKFVEKGDFEKIVAHVEGGYKKVVERALYSYDIIFTAENGLLSESSLKRLAKEVEGYDRYDLYSEIFSHMSLYQFGVQFEGRVRGRYPNLELVDGERIARIDTRYGMLDVYEAGARTLLSAGAYIVEIGDFEPSNTIFAAGVIQADERIRPNDIVVFHSERVLGVGQAAMSGKEMTELDKGIAIKIRRELPLR